MIPGRRKALSEPILQPTLWLPACKTFVLISLLNGYVCAFLAVRRIAQWDRYRLYSKRTRKTGADGREWKLFGEKGAGKLKMLSRSHPRSLHGVLSNGFSLKHYFQFGFWFSWFKLLLTAAVQKYNRASREQNLNSVKKATIFGKSRAREWSKPRQSKCECCVPLSVGLLYDIN